MMALHILKVELSRNGWQHTKGKVEAWLRKVSRAIDSTNRRNGGRDSVYKDKPKSAFMYF